MHRYVGPRLSAMMFLQFFIWGAWYVTVNQYMAKIGMDESIGWAYTVGPIAAIISPFFLGMVADRFFATERVLGVMHLLGGVAIFFSPEMAQLSLDLWQDLSADLTAQGIDPAQQATEYVINPAHLPFIGMLLVHMLCFMPTLGLTNTLAFHNITDQERQFPIIRVFGTIGWIAAILLVSRVLHADEQSLPLRIAGGAAVLLGLYSFTLPHTPPTAAGEKARIRDVLGLESLSLMRSPSFSVFIVSSMLICIPLAAYYSFASLFVNHAGFHDPAFNVMFGQIAEILFMLIMPLMFVRLGVKWMLLVGMLAWVARYGLFSAAADDGVVWMILLGILLHGICYDFFFVTGQIYVDKKAPVAIRGQAQGFLVLVTQGIGLGIGAQLIQRIVNAYKSDDAAELAGQAEALRRQYEALSEQAEQSPAQAETLLSQANEAWNRASELLLQSYNWERIWLICAVAALVVMVLFAVLFHDRFSRRERESITEGEVSQAASREEQP
ncbi:MAG: MFS transporter [Planctomycetes bacterium]|nr:MFS transporter [Planctomycetota bacterium]